VDRPPVPTETVPPVYPPDALRARIRGIVALEVLVSEKGLPLEVRVVRAARAGLTEAAVESVRQWRFRPATRRGVPVATWLAVEIPFEAIPYAVVTPRRTASPEPTATHPTPTPSPRPRRSEGPGTASVTMEAPPPRPPEPLSTLPVGDPAAVYRTRRAVRLGITPDQARIVVDGRYIGVALDWDDRSGGSVLELSRGPHHLRAELSGYESLDLEIDVLPAADDDAVAVLDHLTRRTRGSLTPLPRVVAVTKGAVELDVEPEDASVSVNGRDLGPASAFSSDRPLQLPGPAVHELTFSAPGHPTRQVRVLVARSAPSDSVPLAVTLR